MVVVVRITAIDDIEYYHVVKLQTFSLVDGANEDALFHGCSTSDISLEKCYHLYHIEVVRMR